MLKKTNIQIKGTHCSSCKTLIETEINHLKGVKKIDVDYKSGDTYLEYDNEKTNKEEIIKTIEKVNYQVASQIKQTEKKEWNYKKLIIAGVLFIVFIYGYYLIKQFGWLEIMSKLNEPQVSYGLVLLIGLLASFHCIGMCGGLVVTYSANEIAKQKGEKKSFTPHFQYNLGRFLSYTIIGGILGGIGSFFAINPNFQGTVLIIASIFMVLMGLSLLTNFKWLKKIQLKTPSFIAKFLYSQRHTKKPKGPLIIGLLTGFMPCGPLQAMQLYALTTGSVSRGALSMGIYALGTIPLMFGFGSFLSLISQEKVKKVMKFSGIIVILLAIFMLNRGLINFGYGFRGFASAEQTSKTEFIVEGNVQEYQVANMDLSYRGYEPNVLFVKKNVPVKWIINVKQMSGCTDEIIMPDYNIKKKLNYGKNIIEFTPTKTGDIKFSCWMQMVWGKFVVTENDTAPSQQQIIQEQLDVPQGSSCSGNGSCGGGCGQPSCGCKSRIKPN